MDTVRYGLIGVGNMGTTHLKNFMEGKVEGGVIVAVADVYDALVSERVYKKPFSAEKAREIIREGSGTQFDPELVPLFLKCVGDDADKTTVNF